MSDDRATPTERESRMGPDGSRSADAVLDDPVRRRVWTIQLRAAARAYGFKVARDEEDGQ